MAVRPASLAFSERPSHVILDGVEAYPTNRQTLRRLKNACVICNTSSIQSISLVLDHGKLCRHHRYSWLSRNLTFIRLSGFPAMISRLIRNGQTNAIWHRTDYRTGSFVEVRGRPWLVEEFQGESNDFAHSLSCISDDAQGERLEVLWDAEIGASCSIRTDGEMSAAGLPDRAEVLAAHLRAIRWRSASAADRDLLQAPFRAGIRLDAYQLLPLRKALRLPRVNLLIADDVGLGKTVEAGLVARELLLRRRIDFIVIAAPPAMTIQWKDELEAKFGLSFEIIDRERDRRDAPASRLLRKSLDDRLALHRLAPVAHG